MWDVPSLQGLVLLMFSFTSRCWMAKCASLNLRNICKQNGAIGTRNAVGTVLKGNLGSCHPWRSYFDMYHQPKHCCRFHCFHGNCVPRCLFQQDNVPCHKAKIAQEWYEKHNEFEVLTWPPSSPDLNPVGCVGQTGLKWFVANIFVLDSTAHFQGSSGVSASKGKGCFGNKSGTNTVLGRWSQCHAWLVYIIGN